MQEILLRCEIWKYNMISKNLQKYIIKVNNTTKRYKLKENVHGIVHIWIINVEKNLAISNIKIEHDIHKFAINKTSLKPIQKHVTLFTKYYLFQKKQDNKYWKQIMK